MLYTLTIVAMIMVSSDPPRFAVEHTVITGLSSEAACIELAGKRMYGVHGTAICERETTKP